MKRTPVHSVLLREVPVLKVTFLTDEGWPVTVEALCDTGASSSSIDEHLAEFVGVEYTGTIVKVRNANGVTKRRRCYAEFDCEVGIISTRFTVADRSKLTNPVILGRDVLYYAEEEEE